MAITSYGELPPYPKVTDKFAIDTDYTSVLGISSAPPTNKYTILNLVEGMRFPVEKENTKEVQQQIQIKAGKISVLLTKELQEQQLLVRRLQPTIEITMDRLLTNYDREVYIHIRGVLSYDG